MFVLAVIGAGGVFTGTNPAYTQTELSRHLRETKARFLISDPNLLSKMGPAVVECGLSPSKIFILDGEDHTVLSQYRSWKELLNFGKADWVTFTEPDQAHDTTAALMSTSGTSGLPKAAMISHASMITQTVMLDDMKQKPYQVRPLWEKEIMVGTDTPRSRASSLCLYSMHSHFLSHIHYLCVTVHQPISCDDLNCQSFFSRSTHSA